MAAKFEVKKTANGQFMFNLEAANGETILTSEMYKSKSGCMNGIRSVKENARMPERFMEKTSKNGQPYFVLRAGNYRVIGRSEMYSSSFAMENGKQSVRSNAPYAEVVDLTE